MGRPACGLQWYATRIQKMWRGILTRRYMGVYRRECAWIREQEVTAVFKSQRAFRCVVVSVLDLVHRPMRTEASVS